MDYLKYLLPSAVLTLTGLGVLAGGGVGVDGFGAVCGNGHT